MKRRRRRSIKNGEKIRKRIGPAAWSHLELRYYDNQEIYRAIYLGISRLEKVKRLPKYIH